MTENLLSFSVVAVSVAVGVGLWTIGDRVFAVVFSVIFYALFGRRLPVCISRLGAGVIDGNAFRERAQAQSENPLE